MMPSPLAKLTTRTYVCVCVCACACVVSVATYQARGLGGGRARQAAAPLHADGRVLVSRTLGSLQRAAAGHGGGAGRGRGHGWRAEQAPRAAANHGLRRGKKKTEQTRCAVKVVVSKIFVQCSLATPVAK